MTAITEPVAEGAVRGQGQHAFAHSEDLGGATGDSMEAAMNRGSLTRAPRPLIRLAVSSAYQCQYYMAPQRHQLAGLGVMDAKIAVISLPNNADLSARERAAIRFVLAIRQGFLSSE